MAKPDILPPSLDDLEALANAAFKSLPDHFVRHIRNMVIRVEDFPDEETEREMELESPFDILGLYRGVSLDRKSSGDPAPMPDMIFPYPPPIPDYWCETGEALAHVVRHVLIHEIGHHFGLSDDDMEAIEAQVSD